MNSGVTGFIDNEVDEEIDTSNYEGGETKPNASKKFYSSRKTRTYDDVASSDGEEV